MSDDEERLTPAERRAKIAHWKQKLGECRAGDWVKAHCIMSNISALQGKNKRSMNHCPQPRICSYCGYFSHTKLYCAKKKADDARQAARELERAQSEYKQIDDELLESRRRRDRDAGKLDQGQYYDLVLEAPWEYSPFGTGPIRVFGEGRGIGVWVWGPDGRPVRRGQSSVDGAD